MPAGPQRCPTASRDRYAAGVTNDPTPPLLAPLRRACILSIGSELTVGDTRDTNAGELARALTAEGVAVERLTAVPDRLEVVVEAFTAALERAELVLSTGGLGPTPDDLTREAIATVCGETPIVDPDLERWLRGLWRRRGLPFPEINRKQAWIIPSSEALPNPNGTAPGWFVRRPDGRVLVAMPGPPREMRPMWHDEAVPRLRARGLGAPVAARTYRLMGIGESQVAELLGEALLRAANPIVATYARADAVDVRISATDASPALDGADASGAPVRSAETLVAEAATVVEARLGPHIWATGDTTWPGAIGARLADLGWRLATNERGTGGQLGALLGDVPWLRLGEAWSIDDGRADDGPAALEAARAVRTRAEAEVGVAVRARLDGDDTTVTIAVVTPSGEDVDERTAFLGGGQGRTRAALATAAVVFARLRDARRD